MNLKAWIGPESFHLPPAFSPIADGKARSPQSDYDGFYGL